MNHFSSSVNNMSQFKRKDIDPKKLKNMLLEELSEKAKEVISIIKSKIIFANETYSYGDYDEDGPTEYYYNLLLLVKDANGRLSKLKFYREKNYHGHGNADYYSEGYYIREQLFVEDNDVFDAIISNLSSNEHHPDLDYK